MPFKALMCSIAGLLTVGTMPVKLQAQDTNPQDVALEEQVESLTDRVRRLERDVRDLEDDISDKADAGFILFLFGVFCALWAQNTGRGPWLWFFMGAFFNVITVLVLLSKNAGDRRAVAEQSA
jgi:hypothetical protein